MTGKYPLVTIIRYEWLQEWRRQAIQFGLPGTLALPMLALLAYLGLHALFFLLLAADHGVHTPTDPIALQGWLLIGLFSGLLFFLLPTACDLVTQHTSRELVRSSPFSPVVFMGAKLMAMTLRTALASLFLLTPSANVRAVFGQHTLLWSYPGAVGVGALASASAILVASLMVRVGRGRSLEHMAGWAGLLTAALVSIGFLVRTTMPSPGISAWRIETNAMFRGIGWLGGGLSSSATASIMLLASGLVLLACSTMVLAWVSMSDRASDNQGSTRHRLNSAPSFARSPRMAMVRKELRSCLRDARIRMDMVRILVVAIIIFVLSFREARSLTLPVMAVMLVAACAVATNETSWRMLANEHLPSLVKGAPAEYMVMVYSKAIAAGLPPMLLLTAGAIALAFMSIPTA